MDKQVKLESKVFNQRHLLSIFTDLLISKIFHIVTGFDLTLRNLSFLLPRLGFKQLNGKLDISSWCEINKIKRQRLVLEADLAFNQLGLDGLTQLCHSLESYMDGKIPRLTAIR